MYAWFIQMVRGPYKMESALNGESRQSINYGIAEWVYSVLIRLLL